MTAASYRIGFLNPWRGTAEAQAYSSLRVGAERIGHSLVHVSNSEEIIAADLDFVIAVEPAQAKTTAVPTFGAIHSPRSILLQPQVPFAQMNYLHSLLTYDGYLTIADSLERFLRAFCAGAGKPLDIGFYYNTPQRQFLTCHVDKLAAAGSLRLCYFGTNWEARLRPAFRALSQRRYMRIYGPERGWKYLNGVGYFGSVPFDGHSVQKIYAAFGAGLVSLSRQHALDDVISNRIFEIASVGAVAICPDIPWVRKYFGDSVFYYDPFEAPSGVVAQVDTAMAAIAADPAGAAERARRARAIFEEKFAAEVLLRNAVDYYEAWRAHAGRPADPADGPAIDVIMRVGERPAANVRRAVASIEAQSAGAFRVICVRSRPLDLGDIAAGPWTRIRGFEILDEPGGGRAALLRRGLAAVRSPYFAVLDDDGFWLSGHIAGLLDHLRRCPSDRGFAYSGWLRVASPNPEEPARETRHIASILPVDGDPGRLRQRLAINAFLASSSLLANLDFDAATADAAADTVLQATLLSRAEPVFCYRAAVCRWAEAGRPEEPPISDEDDFETVLRLYFLADRIARRSAPEAMSEWPLLSRLLQQIHEERTKALTGNATTLVLEGNAIVASIHERDDLEVKAIELTPERVAVSGQSRLVRQDGQPALVAFGERQAWSYWAIVHLDPAELFPGRQWVVVEFAPVEQPVGIGVLDASREDFQVRVQVPVSALPIEIWLHIHDPADISVLVVQNWDPPATAEVTVRKVWLVRETAEADQDEAAVAALPAGLHPASPSAAAPPGGG